MSKLFATSFAIAIALFSASSFAMQEYSLTNICRCQDRNGDGRFGLVRYTYGKDVILAGDYGSKDACIKLARKYDSCYTDSVRIFGCKDLDHDGLYGIVQYTQAGFSRYIVASNSFYNVQQCANRAKDLE